MDIREMNEEAEEMDVEPMDAMEDIDDPYEYLDALEENYRDFEEKEGTSFEARLIAIKRVCDEEGVTLEQLAASDNLTLREWLNKQQALYRQDGVAPGVEYIDEVDSDRQDLQTNENKLWSASLDAIEAALDVIEANMEEKRSAALKAMREDAKAVAKHFKGRVKGDTVYVPKGNRYDLLHNTMNKLGWKSRRSGHPGSALFSKKQTMAQTSYIPDRAGKAFKDKYAFQIRFDINPKLRL